MEEVGGGWWRLVEEVGGGRWRDGECVGLFSAEIGLAFTDTHPFSESENDKCL